MGPIGGQIEMVDSRQRFRAERPCPVCGGHAALPQGEGRRCYGFLSADGYHAHCTREECAGHLERNGSSDTFAHRVDGGCRCGKVHGAGPAQARPTAGGDEGASSVHSYRHPKMGKPSQLWPYRYADGELAGYAARWDRLDGDSRNAKVRYELNLAMTGSFMGGTQ